MFSFKFVTAFWRRNLPLQASWQVVTTHPLGTLQKSNFLGSKGGQAVSFYTPT